MENRIFRKSISFDSKYYAFDPENGLHFYFHFESFPEMRKERKRESTPTPASSFCRDRTTTEIAPQHRHHHLDRHYPRPIHPKPISSASMLPISFSFSTQSSSAPRSRHLDLIAPMISSTRSRHPWPISLPMTHDRSLPFPQFLITPSLSLTELWSLTNGVVLIFVFLSLYIENFYYKICLVAKKMNEKMWETSKEIAFSECNQTHENIF